VTLAPEATVAEAALAPELLGVLGGQRTSTRQWEFRPGLILASLFLVLLLIMAIWPGLFAGNPNAINPAEALQGPSLHHLFGTDQLGRDTFDRVVYGTRDSLLLGIGPVILAGLVGAIWGLVAGLGGAKVDEAAMRVADIFMSFPSMLMALLVVAILGPGTRNVIIAIAVSFTPMFARVVRVQTLLVRDSPYVHAAIALGVARRQVLGRHVIPNVVGPLLVLLTMNVGTSLLVGSSLAFIGLGPPPPAPEWGSMLSQAQNYLQASWALAIFPGLAITLTVIAVSVVGRELQTRYEGRGTP
jgi:peptide/nickel transport system permease protein